MKAIIQILSRNSMRNKRALRSHSLITLRSFRHLHQIRPKSRHRNHATNSHNIRPTRLTRKIRRQRTTRSSIVATTIRRLRTNNSITRRITINRFHALKLTNNTKNMRSSNNIIKNTVRRLANQYIQNRTLRRTNISRFRHAPHDLNAKLNLINRALPHRRYLHPKINRMMLSLPLLRRQIRQRRSNTNTRSPMMRSQRLQSIQRRRTRPITKTRPRITRPTYNRTTHTIRLNRNSLSIIRFSHSTIEIFYNNLNRIPNRVRKLALNRTSDTLRSFTRSSLPAKPLRRASHHRNSTNFNSKHRVRRNYALTINLRRIHYSRQYNTQASALRSSRLMHNLHLRPPRKRLSTPNTQHPQSSRCPKQNIHSLKSHRR